MTADPSLSRIVNMAEFRLLTGLSRHLVLRRVEEGMPVWQRPASRGQDYLFNLGDCLRWELGRPKSAGVEVDADGRPIVFEVERARLTKEQADKLARERQEAERELVRRGPIEAALAAQDQALKDRLLMVPVSAAAEALAAGEEAGAPGIADVYERHINRALADVASAELVPAAAH